MKPQKIYPNTFKETTTIEYELIRESSVSIDLLDITGRHLEVLTNDNLQPGTYKKTLSVDQPGVYFLVFRMDEEILTKQIVKIK